MRFIMSERGLQLALEPGQSLPVHLCWRVHAGYLRLSASAHQLDSFTLGIWGPGEIVMPALFCHQLVELRALSTASVHECIPEPAEQQACSQSQLQQMGMLLRLLHIRPAEARLFHLLLWLGQRFGGPIENGRSVPLDAMQLTHRQLAEMVGVSRVSVTKALGHFRQQGWLQQLGDREVLSMSGISRFQALG
jgi:hypothetical protein